jgi:hypothetical protein
MYDSTAKQQQPPGQHASKPAQQPHPLCDGLKAPQLDRTRWLREYYSHCACAGLYGLADAACGVAAVHNGDIADLDLDAQPQDGDDGMWDANEEGMEEVQKEVHVGKKGRRGGGVVIAAGAGNATALQPQPSQQDAGEQQQQQQQPQEWKAALQSGEAFVIPLAAAANTAAVAIGANGGKLSKTIGCNGGGGSGGVAGSSGGGGGLGLGVAAFGPEGAQKLLGYPATRKEFIRQAVFEDLHSQGWVRWGCVAVVVFLATTGSSQHVPLIMQALRLDALQRAVLRLGA